MLMQGVNSTRLNSLLLWVLLLLLIVCALVSQINHHCCEHGCQSCYVARLMFAYTRQRLNRTTTTRPYSFEHSRISNASYENSGSKEWDHHVSNERYRVIAISNTQRRKNMTASSSLVSRDKPMSTIYSSSNRFRARRTTTMTTKLGSYSLLQTVPHDTNAFTQGLIIFNVTDKNKKIVPVTLEGTGLYGTSELRYVNINHGNVLQEFTLERKYFGEGIAHYIYYPPLSYWKPRQRIIQLTWLEQTAFIYEISTNFTYGTKNPILFSPKPIRSVTFNTTTNEGWGITYRPDQRIFYVTDGSSYLNIWNATTFKTISTVQVKQQMNNKYVPVTRLNEIEWDPISQTILANIWQTNTIIRVNPTNGFVQTKFDLTNLYTNRLPQSDVLNGIALTYNFISRRNNQIWVTGKLWPKMYRIQLME